MFPPHFLEIHIDVFFMIPPEFSNGVGLPLMPRSIISYMLPQVFSQKERHKPWPTADLEAAIPMFMLNWEESG